MAEGEPDLWFAFRGGDLLSSKEKPFAVPRAAPEKLGLRVLFWREVGVLRGRRCFAARVEPGAEAPGGMEFRDLRGMLAGAEPDEALFAMAGRAKQILEWDETHRFCGRDGTGTVPGPTPFSKQCPRCGLLFYPRLSPAAIVLVRRGEDEVLLARSPGFPKGMYSVLAGFVEPGESIEETIRREVREEAGVEIGNVRYFGSQPWPFPNSLMIAFVADYAGGELRPDPEELEDAGWYRADDLPMLPPRASIARKMLDEFVARPGPEDR